jgi:hypothetical protein
MNKVLAIIDIILKFQFDDRYSLYLSFFIGFQYITEQANEFIFQCQQSKTRLICILIISKINKLNCLLINLALYQLHISIINIIVRFENRIYVVVC